jgi:thioredoxin 1
MNNSLFSPRRIVLLAMLCVLGFLLLSKPRRSDDAVAPGREVQVAEFGTDLSPGDLVLVKFGATWCGPCNFMDEELKKVDLDTLGVKVVKVDVDKEPKLSDKHKVSGIPHTILVQNGKTLGEFVGAKAAQELTEWIEQARVR